MHSKRIFFYRIFLLVMLLGITGFLVYELFISKERDLKLIKSISVAMVTLIGLLLGGGSRKSVSKRTIIKLYKNDYGKYIDGAFSENRILKKRLETAICLLNADRYDKCEKILDSLYNRCDTSGDFCGVLVFKGLCCQYNGDINGCINTYEEMLRYDPDLPDVWLYLGIAYLKNDDYESFARCNESCLAYDPQNALAFSNLGSYYFRTGDSAKALESCLKAIKLKPSLYQAMSTAAGVYCIMGDTENCRKYQNMYIANGGDADDIKAYIESLKPTDQTI